MFMSVHTSCSSVVLPNWVLHAEYSYTLISRCVKFAATSFGQLGSTWTPGGPNVSWLKSVKFGWFWSNIWGNISSSFGWHFGDIWLSWMPLFSPLLPQMMGQTSSIGADLAHFTISVLTWVSGVLKRLHCIHLAAPYNRVQTVLYQTKPKLRKWSRFRPARQFPKPTHRFGLSQYEGSAAVARLRCVCDPAWAQTCSY
jgi:hypothetical protein